jgi:hypothetical protein
LIQYQHSFISRICQKMLRAICRPDWSSTGRQDSRWRANSAKGTAGRPGRPGGEDPHLPRAVLLAGELQIPSRIDAPSLSRPPKIILHFLPFTARVGITSVSQPSSTCPSQYGLPRTLVDAAPPTSGSQWHRGGIKKESCLGHKHIRTGRQKYSIRK